MAYENILYEKQGRIATCTLNRPEAMNALSDGLRADLWDAVKDAEADDDIRVIIIKGAGRCFSAGYDIGPSARRDKPAVYTAKGMGNWPRSLINGYMILWELYKPVIAQVHGYCLAGGTELASMCDIVMIAEDAIVGYPPVRAMTCVDTLWEPWVLGLHKAMEFLLTGDSITGKEAVELGFANHAYPKDQLEAETLKLANRMANIESDLLGLTKRAVHRAFDIRGFRNTLMVETDYHTLSTFRESASKWSNMVREKGLREALLWRDGPFGDYSANPNKPPK